MVFIIHHTFYFVLLFDRLLVSRGYHLQVLGLKVTFRIPVSAE